ncbi:GGDEF domain-containing protein [Roseibium denhamense]|nr:GGDEF domain-containing protein [Roseibium denhamense]
MPLFSANMLLLSVFAISFLAISFSARPNGHWRSWAVANTLITLALLAFAGQQKLPLVVAYLLPNILLLLGLSFHLQAARSLKQTPTRPSLLIAPAIIYGLVAVPAFILNNYALAYTASNVIFAGMCCWVAWTYASPAFNGLISRMALILAFGIMALEGGVRTTHGLLVDTPFGPGLINDGTTSVYLMISLIFVALSGAFSMAISFEQIAQQNQEEARRDPLTGTFNRREFLRRLEDHLRPASDRKFGLVQFDLDHFKQVNDRFGHVAGDEALVKVCQAIKHHLRQSDCFARLGGEEFGVLLPNVDRDDALKIAERIRALVAKQKFAFAPDDFQLTISGGMYHGKGDGLTPTDLVRIVDQGLYQSKNSGRNRISLTLPKNASELRVLPAPQTDRQGGSAKGELQSAV